MLNTINDNGQLVIKIGLGSDEIIIPAVYMPPRSLIHIYYKSEKLCRNCLDLCGLQNATLYLVNGTILLNSYFPHIYIWGKKSYS